MIKTKKLIINSKNMSQEDLNEPSQEELDKVIGNAKREMDEYYKSEPTPENVSGVMKEVAAQHGENFEAGDPAIPEQDIIDKYEEEGWNLVDRVADALKVSAEEGKKIKIVGLGDEFLIFEKMEEEEE